MIGIGFVGVPVNVEKVIDLMSACMITTVTGKQVSRKFTTGGPHFSKSADLVKLVLIHNLSPFRFIIKKG